ncbi:MAG: PASTA domain-containing protein [Elusimicrobia bacterium]|jgi:beta-lactam-binding protein with PASTA domain|nr:PASTA domain-containing protein [Elusimicrobiota bacterium]
MKKINISKKKILKTGVIIAAAVIVLVVVLTGTINVLMEKIIHSSKEVIVPDITGTTLNEALDILAQRNLSLVKVAQQYNTQIPAGSIISQTPSPGLSIREGSAIDTVISSGGKVVFVPDIEGKSTRQAELMLRQSGLVIGEQSRTYSDSVKSGFVVSQNPPPGEVADKNSYINIVVSRGPAEQKKIQKMPNLLGIDIKSAGEVIREVGLKIKVVEYEINPELNEGIVIGQEPKQGEVISKNTSVNLKVSRNERTEKEVRDEIIYYEVTQSGRKKEVEIKINDKLGTRTVFKEEREGGTKINIPVKVMGDAQAEIFIDGVLTDTKEITATKKLLEKEDKEE